MDLHEAYERLEPKADGNPEIREWIADYKSFLDRAQDLPQPEKAREAGALQDALRPEWFE